MDPQLPQVPGMPVPSSQQEGSIQDPSGQLPQPQMDSTQSQPVVIAKPAQEEVENEDQLDEVWVAKARQIVEQTKDDPFKQTRAISRIKADFLKTRYQKELKVNED